MVSLIVVNIVIIFVLILQLHMVIPNPPKKGIIWRMRDDCMRYIITYFGSRDNVHKHGQNAIKKYNEYTPLTDFVDEYSPLTDINEVLTGYYKSFKDFLRPGKVKSPEDFCTFDKSIECVEWVKLVFGSDPLEAVQRAFYKLRLADLQNIKLSYNVSLDSLKTMNVGLRFAPNHPKHEFSGNIISDDCYRWILTVFGKTAILPGEATFYKLPFYKEDNQVQVLHIPIESVYDLVNYLLSIAENYGLETNGFSNPYSYCCDRYKIPKEKDASATQESTERQTMENTELKL